MNLTSAPPRCNLQLARAVLIQHNSTDSCDCSGSILMASLKCQDWCSGDGNALLKILFIDVLQILGPYLINLVDQLNVSCNLFFYCYSHNSIQDSFLVWHAKRLTRARLTIMHTMLVHETPGQRGPRHWLQFFLNTLQVYACWIQQYAVA